MEKLTKRQSQVLKFITEFINTNGFSPSIRDIASKFRIYVRAAYDHLLALEKKGYITRDKGRTRSILLTAGPKISELSHFPVLGRVSAGNPLEAVENIEDYLIVSKNLFKGDEIFALKVRGDSMINAGIYEDDFVVVKVKHEVKDGDIIVALVGDETTIKRIYFETDSVRLVPENPKYEPMRLRNIKVVGKVIGLLRKFN